MRKDCPGPDILASLPERIGSRQRPCGRNRFGLSEPLDGRQELRRAFGSFLTGVSVVTAIDADEHPRGLTANSFTTVSLAPPLVLVCIDHRAGSYGVMRSAGHFAVNILSETQDRIARTFSSPVADRFAAVPWRAAFTGAPIIEGALCWLDCRVDRTIEAGDHLILIGEVKAFSHRPGPPLGYFRGGFLASLADPAPLPPER